MGKFTGQWCFNTKDTNKCDGNRKSNGISKSGNLRNVY